jgi:DNA-binding NarL/FixJ family response regulator
MAVVQDTSARLGDPNVGFNAPIDWYSGFSPEEGLRAGMRRTASLSLVTTNRIVAQLLGRRLHAQVRSNVADLSWIDHTLPPEVVLFDGRLDPDTDEIKHLMIRCRGQRLSTVVFGCSPSPLVAATWLDLGATELSYADEPIEQLVEKIELVRRGENAMGIGVRENLLGQLRASRSLMNERVSQFESLTKRETEVLQLLAQGTSPEDISKSSFVSLNTIRTQIRNILVKLSTSSVVAAVALAYRSGWIVIENEAKAD